MHRFVIALLTLVSTPALAQVYDCSQIGSQVAPASHVNAQCEDLCTYDPADNTFTCQPDSTMCLEDSSGDLDLTVINYLNRDYALVGYGNCATSSGYQDFCCVMNPNRTGQEVDEVVIRGTDGWDDLFFNSNEGWLLASPQGTREGYIHGRHGEDLIGGSNEMSTSYTDYLYGDNGRDEIYGLLGNDYLYGLSGTDHLYGGGGDDWVYGGAHRDFLWGDGDDDHLYGGGGNDDIEGGNGEDWLYGQNGHDTLDGGHHDDHLYGGNQGDTLLGGWGNDYLNGFWGDDTLDGGGNDDILVGGGGTDWLDGGSQDDILWGGTGNDTLEGGVGSDTLCDTENDANGHSTMYGGRFTLGSNQTGNWAGDYDRAWIEPAVGGPQVWVHSGLNDMDEVTNGWYNNNIRQPGSLILLGTQPYPECVDAMSL